MMGMWAWVLCWPAKHDLDREDAEPRYEEDEEDFAGDNPFDEPLVDINLDELPTKFRGEFLQKGH